ncbi:MAG: glycosyltransferase [Bacteroidota bacterium]
MEHICFFNTAIAWGGGEKWHFEVSSYLHRKGHPLVVFAHKNSVLLQKLVRAKVPAESVEISNLSFLNPFKHQKLRRQLGKYPIKTIVMNLSRDVKIAGQCAKAIGIKNIIYRRGSAIPIKNTVLNRYYFKKVITAILTNSEATKRTILQKNTTLFPEERIRVIYNGIDIPENQKVLLDQTSKKKEPFVLLNLGRLEEQKNQKFLLDLAQELLYRNLSFRILIGGEGRLKAYLKQAIQDRDLEQVVKLCGFIESPYGFIQKADVFVLPSLWEGFGYVLAEASLCKKPIIAFDLSSNPELVIPGSSGFLVPKNNVAKFADAVETLYNNPELAARMGKSGWKHIVKHFEKENQLLKVEAYLTNE